ncbi:MAG: S8 family serine peptidase [Planctomycetota bacterium]
MNRNRFAFALIIAVLAIGFASHNHNITAGEPKKGDSKAPAVKLLKTESVSGKGVWVEEASRRGRNRETYVTVWFDKQFLGDGKAYKRRAKEFKDWKRTELRAAVMATLKALSKESHEAAKAKLDELEKAGKISNVRPHWIINGFTCRAKPEGVEGLKSVPGVKKIFRQGGAPESGPKKAAGSVFKPVKDRPAFDPDRYKHPWYIHYLMAYKTWKDFGVTGKNTLNVIHDVNFVYNEGTTTNLYRNPKEIPGNGKDDDNNGLIDDYHGYNFSKNQADVGVNRNNHGFCCAAIICGSGTKNFKYEFGIAPEGRWAGVLGINAMEDAIEWAVEHNADTYSMSFSLPGLGEFRSHWRKIMEHGSFCGIYFVSGAGNFGQKGSRNYAPIPVQMRSPEDIPEVVFAAAGVQRDFSKTEYSSKGPVVWKTEHYRDGKVQKPEVCAFNHDLPVLLQDGDVSPSGLHGNSFAGPMFCGSIALMVSADPELLPWDLKEIITTTATDAGPRGVDYETGHGLINCYRAVKEVLRRKAIREGKDPKPYTGREKGDEVDIKGIQKKLKKSTLCIQDVTAGSQAAKLGLKAGDVITHYNGATITNRKDFQEARKKAKSRNVKLAVMKLLRDGKPLEVKVNQQQIGIMLGTMTLDPVFR